MSRFRKNIVFGRGNLPADILFIGEAPGKSEDALGRPFVGPSGKMLEDAIKYSESLARARTSSFRLPTYFITNVVACRPTDKANGDNRPPLPAEVMACRERLMTTLVHIHPRRIVFLGEVARKNYIRIFPDATCLAHPAYLLRKGGTMSPDYKEFTRVLSGVFLELQ